MKKDFRGPDQRTAGWGDQYQEGNRGQGPTEGLSQKRPYGQVLLPSWRPTSSSSLGARWLQYQSQLTVCFGHGVTQGKSWLLERRTVADELEFCPGSSVPLALTVSAGLGSEEDS